MKTASPRIMTVNGGSSSIKFALFEAGESLRRALDGSIERIGLPDATFAVEGSENFSRPLAVPNHTIAVNVLMDWLEERSARDALTAVGHRVVHGGPKYSEPQRITAEMVEDLRQLSPFDPDHMPEEILLTEAFHRRFPNLPQVACFDTAFHHDLPQVARLLPIPRRYEGQGVRRYGFHGLSYAFLMAELARLAGSETAQGLVILAHLGNGASLAAVGQIRTPALRTLHDEQLVLDRQRLGRDRTNPAGTGQPRQGHQQVSNQPEPQRHAAPEFNALPPIRKPALRDRPVPELAIRHTQAGFR